MSNDDAVYRTRHAVTRAVETLVRDAHGEAGFIDAPVFPGAKSIITKARPIPALQAAIKVRDIAAGHIRRAITDVRGGGSSWAELAATLGLDSDDHRWAAEKAYDYAKGPQPSAEEQERDFLALARWRDARIYWTCGTCDAHVTDHGPYDPHPEDQEQGHADDCTRHAAAVAAYQRSVEEDW
ncbi:MAG: hypothetical protein ACRD0P_38665 [Stackebrandtia sp.]